MPRPRPSQPVTAVTVTARNLTTAETKQRERAGLSRGGYRGPRPVYTETRNGLPELAFYTWRARRYPAAEQALARAEAIHGKPANEAH